MSSQNDPDAIRITLSDRIKDAAEILSIEEKLIYDALEKAGIDNSDAGLMLLDSDVVSENDLSCAFHEGGIEKPILKMKAAVATLRGKNPFKKHLASGGRKGTLAESIAEGIKLDPLAGLVAKLPSSRPDYKQLSDKDLLELFIQDDHYEFEQELHRRSKQQPFIVFGPDKVIDREASLDLLKRARRMINPTMVPVGDTIVPVYRITEINSKDNVMDLCPICGEVLYKSYCDKCEVNLGRVDDDARAYVNLISKSSNFDAKNFSDKKAVIASSTKGVEDLRKTWPSVMKQFDELKLTNNLPSLRKIRSLPSVVKPADPFNVK